MQMRISRNDLTMPYSYLRHDPTSSGTYFYRCFSNSSAGGLISGRGFGIGRLSHTCLQHEFESHMRIDATAPTALISVSTRIVDTVQRAFNRYYRDLEDPRQIWIAFIFVPDSEKQIYYHAEDLARTYGYGEWKRLKYEYIFTWEIPEEYVLHRISVETFMARGLDMSEYYYGHELPPTSVLRGEIARSILHSTMGGWRVGVELGLFARKFGARAPVWQIANQLLDDCAYITYIDEDTGTLG
jgi:hypothetical protein